MRSKLASLGALFGLLTALMLGMAGAANATTDPEFDCANVLGAVVCDNTVDVPVDIKVTIVDTNVLNGTQLNLLEEGIDAVVDADVTKNDIKVAVLNVYDNEFNIQILSNNVIVLGDIPCGC